MNESNFSNNLIKNNNVIKDNKDKLIDEINKKGIFIILVIDCFVLFNFLGIIESLININLSDIKEKKHLKQDHLDSKDNIDHYKSLFKNKSNFK
jgi:hypothetical protein